MAATQLVSDESTPVDDVRRVRERIERETNGSIEALAERSRAAFERYRVSLDLQLVTAPKNTIDLPANTA